MGLFGLGKVKPEHVFERGEEAVGRLVGIDIGETSAEDAAVRVDDYALHVGGSAGFTCGIRQRLDPDRLVRLGMAITVRHLDGRAVIDWAATCGGTGYQGGGALLKTPPTEGIVDATLGLDKMQRKGVAATVLVTGAAIRDAMLGLSQVLALDLAVTAEGVAGYDTQLTKVQVPHYASHLVEVGAMLPAWVRLNRLDRVVIDWPAAAMASPGVGQASSVVLDGLGNVFTGRQGDEHANAVQVVDDRPIAAEVDGGHVPIDGVDFDCWVAVGAGLIGDRVAPGDYDAYAQGYGVAPGAWAGAAAGWQQRMMGDWRLGAAYGEAIASARKRGR
ncbi:MAG: hypothetical protein ABIP03_15170 [Aquihabitans sp.]